MGMRIAAAVIGLAMVVSSAAIAAEDAKHAIHLSWRKIAETMAADNQPSLGEAGRLSLSWTREPRGQIIGLQNAMVLKAGGLEPGSPEDAGQAGTFLRDIWVAALPDASGDAEGAPLAFRKAEGALPQGLAFAATVDSPLGSIILGGVTAEGPADKVYLLRYDALANKAEALSLPSLPQPASQVRAALLSDMLYAVLPGESGWGLYRLDLRRLTAEGAASANALSGWQWVMGLPAAFDGPERAAEQPLALAAQYDGRRHQLYLVSGIAAADSGAPGGQRRDHKLEALWAFNPEAMAAPAIGDGNGHGDAAGADWRRLAIPASLSQSSLASFSVQSLGQSHLLFLAAPREAAQVQAFSYNAVTEAWAAYELPEKADAALAGFITDESRLAAWDGRMMTLSPWGVGAFSFAPPYGAFGAINMSVLVLYLVAVVAIGLLFTARNKDTNDYFRGGQNIPWWAAACSIYSTMLSSLTYVALPALVYQSDWRVYIGIMMVVAVAPIAIYMALPFFRQINATSAYEYLSRRFNMPVRLMASLLFSLFHISRIGIVLALTALALSAVTQLSPYMCVLIMGVLCLIYSTLGGVEAVVWTDTMQTIVLLLGAVVCFGFIIAGTDGGIFGFIEIGRAADKFTMASLDFGPGSAATLSLWVIVLGGFGQNLSSYTADQAVVQRYMVTRDSRAAKRSIATNAVIAVPATLLFFGIGTGLYVFYKSRPESLDPTLQLDQIFPTFIASELPVGLAGLLVAGIFAAAQSTVSTSMNSIATTIVTDFMRPINLCKSEKGYLLAAKWFTFLVGTVGMVAGLFFIDPAIRSLMEEYFKVIGMFMGALGGLFLLGMLSKRATGLSAFLGLVGAVVLMMLVWRHDWANGYLFASIGIGSCLLFGYMASWVLPRQDKDLTGLTLFSKRIS